MGTLSNQKSYKHVAVLDTTYEYLKQKILTDESRSRKTFDIVINEYIKKAEGEVALNETNTTK